jgi:hypothetical protein
LDRSEGAVAHVADRMLLRTPPEPDVQIGQDGKPAKVETAIEQETHRRWRHRESLWNEEGGRPRGEVVNRTEAAPIPSHAS